MHLVAANSSASCDAQSKDAQPSEATPKLVSVGLTPAAWATSEGAGKICSWFLGLNQHLFFVVLCFVLSLALASLFRTIIEDALHLSRQ